MALDSNRQHEHNRSSSPSSAAPAAVVNPIRQPTAFAAPNPTTSSGPTFYYKDKTKTPIHAAMSADGTSVFCVEGYVNTPELSAGRGGGLSQGLPANGPYRSLFRAGSRSESNASAGSHLKTNAAAAPALHVLAEAAQSPEALSPVSVTASPKPAPTCTPAPVPSPTSVSTSKKRTRKPSPLIASTSPTSPVVRPSPVASTNASSSSSQSHIILDPSPPPRHPRTKSAVAGSSTSGKGKQRETHPPVPLEAPGDGNGNGESSEQRFERSSLLSSRQLSEWPGTQLHDPESAGQDRFRYVQKNKNKAEISKEVGSPPQAPPTPADHSYEGDYFPSHFEAGLSGAGDIAYEGGHSPSPPQAIANYYPTSARATSSKESSLALKTDSRSVTPGIKPRMVTLLIEDRRHGTDELVEVHVPLKTAGEGCLWADAKDVCAALQSGPSRIDGTCMRCC